MIRLYAALGAAAAIAGLGLYAWGLNSRLDMAQAERDTARNNAAVFEQSLRTERADKILAESMNAKYLEDLRNAKSEIDYVRASVDSGAGELRINAECTESRSVPSTASSVSKPDAAAPRLSDTAVKNYFVLQERHAEAVNQILGLQAYITEFCSKKIPR